MPFSFTAPSNSSSPRSSPPLPSPPALIPLPPLSIGSSQPANEKPKPLRLQIEPMTEPTDLKKRCDEIFGDLFKSHEIYSL